MTAPDLDALKAAWEAATPGVWRWGYTDKADEIWADRDAAGFDAHMVGATTTRLNPDSSDQSKADAYAIMQLHNAFPGVLALIEEQAAEIEQQDAQIVSWARIAIKHDGRMYEAGTQHAIAEFTGTEPPPYPHNPDEPCNCSEPGDEGHLMWVARDLKIAAQAAEIERLTEQVLTWMRLAVNHDGQMYEAGTRHAIAEMIDSEPPAYPHNPDEPCTCERGETHPKWTGWAATVAEQVAERAAELAEARATIARVEAVAEEWDIVEPYLAKLTARLRRALRGEGE